MRGGHIQTNAPHNIARSPQFTSWSPQEGPVQFKTVESRSTTADSLTIDGSKTPELIPDDKAYHILFLTASVKSYNPSASAYVRARAVVNGMKLPAADETHLAELAGRYRKEIEQQPRTSIDESVFQENRRQLVSSYVSQMKGSLSLTGNRVILAYLQHIKQHMKLVSVPEMQSPADLWNKLSSGTVVHAQSMIPNPASLYSDVIYSDSDHTIYGVGVTDATSSCSCHQTRVSTTISGPVTSNYGEAGDLTERAEIDVPWNPVDGDFTDGDLSVQSTHYAFCPQGGGNFVNSVTSGSLLPIQSHIAYYFKDQPSVYTRCTQTGTTCDHFIGFGSPNTFILFGLYKAVEINIGVTRNCVELLVKKEDKCYYPDPKP